MKIVCGLALLCASAWVEAAGFDGSKPLLCAVTNTVSCDFQGDCIEGPATAINMPVFIKIDFQNKTAESTRESGEKRSSKILSMHEGEGALVLLGFEQSAGWSAAISETSGHLTVTAAAQDVAYMIFGACTVLESVVD
jgi:hypothetical protein